MQKRNPVHGFQGSGTGSLPQPHDLGPHFFPTPHCSAALLPGCTQNTIVFQANAGFELLILLPGSSGISSMYNHTRYVTCL